MKRGRGVLLALLSVLPGLAVGVTFAAAVNLYNDFHPWFFIGTAVTLALAWLTGFASLRAFRVPKRLAWRLPLALAIAWTGVFFVFCWATYPDLGAAAREHGLVLRTLPVYPGARLSSEDTWGDIDSEFQDPGFVSPPTEILTRWIWYLPEGAHVRVAADWYEARLEQTGWVVVRDLDEDDVVDLSLSKPASISRHIKSLDLEIAAAESRQVGSDPRVRRVPIRAIATAE